MQSNIGAAVDGYVVNIPIDPSLELEMSAIVDYIKSLDSNLWIAPFQAWHITVLDWITPSVRYSHLEEDLLRDLLPRYDATLSLITSANSIFDVQFTMLEIRNGVAFLSGDECSSLMNIRQRFTDYNSLVGATKPPPSIVHATVARNIDPSINLTINIPPVRQQVNSLRLVHETAWPMIEFESVKRYALCLRLLEATC